MTRSAVGELEHLVLLAIGRLEGHAYAVRVVEEIRERTGRDLAQASIYVVLGRLEDKGFLRSRLGEATAERGGRPKRFYSLTERAVEELRSTRTALHSMWEGLELLADEPGLD